MWNDFMSKQGMEWLFIGISLLVILWLGLKAMRYFFSRSRENQVKKLFTISPNHQLAVVTFQTTQYTLLLHKQGGLLLDKRFVEEKVSPELNLKRRSHYK